MNESQPAPDPRPLANINQLIHAPVRLMILAYLFVVDSVDYVFLMRQTNLSWGNLATHLNKLEEAGYVEIQKTFNGKKPQSILRMTEQGRSAFRAYKKSLQQVLDDLPD